MSDFIRADPKRMRATLTQLSAGDTYSRDDGKTIEAVAAGSAMPADRPGRNKRPKKDKKPKK